MAGPVVGICSTRGKLPDAVARRFFEAAYEFHESEVWKLLMQTRHREFGLRIPGMKGMKAKRGSLELYSTVELQGLQSVAMNGERGEVLESRRCKKPKKGKKKRDNDEEKDIRLMVRLFSTGQRVRVKESNLNWVGYQEEDTIVVKVLGADGGSTGIMMYGSWAEWSMNQPGLDRVQEPLPEPPAGGYLEVNYMAFESYMSILAKDIALYRRLHLPLCTNGKIAEDGTGTENFPVLIRGGGTLFTTDEVELATVALIAATRFFPRLVQRPDPPKPYPASYSYEPQVLDLADLEAFGGRGDGVETQAVGKIPEAAVGARCAFPSGDILMQHRPWASYPGFIIGRCGVTRPPSVKTIEEAVAYHRAALAGRQGRLDERRRVGHEFALANALWEMETPESVVEACTFGWRVLEATEDCGDPSVGTFLLDVLMECGDWEGAVRLLSRFSDRQDVTWIWCTPLVYFKLRGPSRSSKEALRAAITANPYVARRLLNEATEIVQKKSHQGALWVRKDYIHDVREVPAGEYYSNFKQHWYREPESIAWLRAVKNSLDAEEENMDNRSDSQVPSPATTVSDARRAFDLSKVVCSRCGGLPPDGKQVSRCGGCLQAVYCSKACQVEAWKHGGHKTECKRIQRERAAAAAIAKGPKKELK